MPPQHAAWQPRHRLPDLRWDRIGVILVLLSFWMVIVVLLIWLA